MRTMLIATAAGALLAAALPASAQPSAANASRADDNAASGQNARAGNGGERRICVSERLSDSRMRRRICHTAREWQNLQGDDER